jgi:hypothetical protein
MEAKNDNTKLEYSGIMADYQLNNQKKKTYMQYEKDSFTDYQNHLYKRALYGLSAFEKIELEVMCSKKKMRVSKVHKKAQKVINLYKQKLTIAYSNQLFESFFPNSPITEYLLEDVELDNSFKNTLSFKELGISKQAIADLFVTEGILPKNFINILKNPNSLPKLKYGKEEKAM